MRQYSQHLIDVLDLEENAFRTLPIRQVIGEDFKALRLVASEDTGQFVQQFLTKPARVDPARLVFTFETLAGTPAFTDTMRNMMQALERRYGYPVDIEFAAEVTKTYPRPEFHISLLQCRPLTARESKQSRPVPANVPPDDRLFSAHRQVPEGTIERVRYVVFVKPDAYHRIRDPQRRLEVGRLVGRINEALKDEEFVLMGPGRWGSSDIQLGVRVTYADIFNTRALIEVAYSSNGGTPEMAYGTHFFQDLVEAEIFPLALFPNEPDVCFNWDFFKLSPNTLPDLLPEEQMWSDVLTVIDVPAVSDGRLLEIVMDADHDEALGYLRGY